jgi:hypothetical protein
VADLELLMPGREKNVPCSKRTTPRPEEKSQRRERLVEEDNVEASRRSQATDEPSEPDQSGRGEPIANNPNAVPALFVRHGTTLDPCHERHRVTARGEAD